VESARAEETEKRRKEQVEAAQKLADEQKRLAAAETTRAQEAEKHAKEQKDSANKLRLRAWIAAGLALVAVIFAGAVALVWQKSESNRAAAEEQARIANVRRLAAESSSALKENPQRSLLLAVEAVKAGRSLHGVRLATAEQALRAALGFIGGRLVARADGPITIVAISPDKRWVVTGSLDKTTRLWFLQMNGLVDLARITVGRNFSADEWWLYFPGEKYRRTFPDLPGPD